ncbi:hypothetical protein QBC35DRAFT_458520 [Podospora australis]|uniref:Uncharacterized protein n=1 Tax=Podospora australis TaxID=1536484 RepID=A0AAN6X5K8_9PEZI|nr:hypothetical protein QBC35DRAFT_458520 [Podospora australis]
MPSSQPLRKINIDLQLVEEDIAIFGEHHQLPPPPPHSHPEIELESGLKPVESKSNLSVKLESTEQPLKMDEYDDLHLRGGDNTDASDPDPDPETVIAQTGPKRLYTVPDSLRFRATAENDINLKYPDAVPLRPTNYNKDPIYSQSLEMLGITEPLVRPAYDHELEALYRWRVTNKLIELKNRYWLTKKIFGSEPKPGEPIPVKGRGMGELKRFGWRPARVQVEITWPDTEFDSVWFETVYGHLYRKTKSFADRYFGRVEIPETNNADVWLAGFSRAFLRYTTLVARQDNFVGGWNKLLSDPRRRQYLVTGILAKVFETQIWDDLFFGANDITKAMLKTQDEALLGLEGYLRTELRSQSIRAALGKEEVPPFFWHRVDTISLQITELLLPLVKLLDKHSALVRACTLRSIHQDVHNLVAEAGLVALGMSMSRDIFRTAPSFLGSAWRIDMTQVDETIWDESGHATDAADKARGVEWDAVKKRTFGRRLSNDPNKTWKDALYSLIGIGPLDINPWHIDLTPDQYYAPNRTSKVQLILWPKLERYSTVGDVNPETQLAYEEAITEVMKNQVVFYRGRTDPRGEYADTHPTLTEHISRQRRHRIVRWLLFPRFLWYLLFLYLVLHLLGALFPFAIGLRLANAEQLLVWAAKFLVRNCLVVLAEMSCTFFSFFYEFMKISVFLVYAFVNTFIRKPLGLSLLSPNFRSSLWRYHVRLPGWGGYTYRWGGIGPIEATIPGWEERSIDMQPCGTWWRRGSDGGVECAPPGSNIEEDTVLDYIRDVIQPLRAPPPSDPRYGPNHPEYIPGPLHPTLWGRRVREAAEHAQAALADAPEKAKKTARKARDAWFPTSWRFLRGAESEAAIRKREEELAARRRGATDQEPTPSEPRKKITMTITRPVGGTGWVPKHPPTSPAKAKEGDVTIPAHLSVEPGVPPTSPAHLGKDTKTGPGEEGEDAAVTTTTTRRRARDRDWFHIPGFGGWRRRTPTDTITTADGKEITVEEIEEGEPVELKEIVVEVDDKGRPILPEDIITDLEEVVPAEEGEEDTGATGTAWADKMITYPQFNLPSLRGLFRAVIGDWGWRPFEIAFTIHYPVRGV